MRVVLATYKSEWVGSVYRSFFIIYRFVWHFVYLYGHATHFLFWQAHTGYFENMHGEQKLSP